MKLITENWKGSTNEESIHEDPDFIEINAALSELNGDSHSLLAIELVSGVVLHVGGGPDSYMSEVVNGDTFMLAIGSPGKEGLAHLVVGGQLSEFGSNAILNYEQARDILLVFCHGDGVLTTTVSWEVA